MKGHKSPISPVPTKAERAGCEAAGLSPMSRKPCSSSMELPKRSFLHLEEICLKVKFICTRDKEEKRVGGGTLVLVFLILIYGRSAIPCTCQLLAWSEVF